MELTLDQAQAFLAEPNVAVLAVADGDGPPLAVPLWYGYEPGGDFWVVTPTRSRKARLLRSAGVATLVVDTVEPRTRYASVDCRLAGERVATTEDRTLLARRYLSTPDADAYVAFAQEDLGPESLMVLRPQTWRTADLTPG